MSSFFVFVFVLFFLFGLFAYFFLHTKNWKILGLVHGGSTIQVQKNQRR